MQAISKIGSEGVIIIIKSTKKFKNIRKFNKKFMFSSCMGGCCYNTLHGTTRRVITNNTTTKVTMMGRLRQQHRGVNVVGVINRVLGAQNSQLIHWQLDSQARAVHGEIPNFPAYDQATQAIQDQFSSYGGLPQGDNSSSSSFNSAVSSAHHPLHQQHPVQSEFAAVSHPLSGVFGESQWFDSLTMENASPSPPPPWQNYSMFMVATEPWPSGTSSRSATTGEQLNTPQPAQNVGELGGFDFGSVFESGSEQRDAASQRRSAKVNLTNVFSKNDINGITKNTGGDFNNNSNNISRKGNDGGISGSMEPFFSNHAESVITAGFDSWEFGPCPEETLLSPMSYMATPHHSPGVASPGSSSGDTGSPNHHRRTSLQEFETCVDFNSVLLSPSSPIVEASEEDDLCAGNLHEEIEQLSSSFYCTSNSLVSVNSNNNNTTAINAGIDVVSPSILKLLQEENQPQQPAKNLPSVETNSYFSDATNDGEDEQHVERKTVEVVAAATSYTADETLVDVKTQTQLEHNYTIQLPSVELAVPAIKKQTTVKEATLATLAKTRETTLRPPQTQHPLQRRPIAPSVKRQLFQRMKSRMDATAVPASPNRKVPNLKLKIINTTEARVVDDSALMTTTQVVLNTPDLTENLLDLEDEFLIKEDNFDLLKYIDSATGYDVIHSPQEEKPVVSFTEPAPAPSTTICGPTLSDLFNPAKRRLPAITIENIDELTATTNASKRFRSATSSATSSVCDGDNGSEASARPAKRRGRPPKPVTSGLRDRSEYDHLSEADMRYREQRDKNNEASRKSRINRKDRESKLEREATELIQKYEVLEGKERELIRDCARWRRAVMRLALL